MTIHFEQLVREAVGVLPRHIKDAMDNVAFVIEDEPRPKKAREVGIRMHETLLGLYEGIPRTKRGPGYFGVLPDKITIFQKPLETLSRGNHQTLKKLVYDVVKHEIGHHFGFNDKELRAIERARSHV
jgi:predicted Zn-dependent protease with MMP-like domain